ncbi:hypothetical protein ONZ51_g535 [Trametes cubensis]|uniref:Natural resistance-associated macrophage protein n=1 Tax=Trametes cubensis TaxID=1111947 RepID=A0AAD7U587_9APHY|nr:hypothetical protein ONZ51_g535 [Trametes cubensis]
MSLLDHPERTAIYQTPALSHAPSWRARLRFSFSKVTRHVTKHIGVGIVCSVAYFDPGNWSVDLQAGSLFGYRPMLFVVLMAGLGAMVLQSLAFKLGCVTGLDLASHCRILLHDRPRYKRVVRYAILYPLYVLSEIAIVSTDLAELIGSAIGLCLIFPSIPLWAAVLITASDVLIFLVLGDPSRGRGRPVKVFEFTVMALVCSRVNGGPFIGSYAMLPGSRRVYLFPHPPRKTVGILGATVMPHALFLGSYLATQDRIAPAPTLPNPVSSEAATLRGKVAEWFKSLITISRAERIAASREYRDKYGRQNNELTFVRAHLTHGLVDVIASLLAVAVPINSAILVIASAVFFKDGSSGAAAPAGLFDAHDLIMAHIGKAAAFIFALALLCAGQTASITATLAGQIVSEGFLEWRVSPFLRRIITRLIGLIPSVVVAIAVGKRGIDTLLVASQVALAIVLPFVAAPLILLTSSKSVMSVRRGQTAAQGPAALVNELSTPLPAVPPALPISDRIEQGPHLEATATFSIDEDEKDATAAVDKDEPSPHDRSEDASVAEVEDGYISFANHWLVTVISSLIFLIILAANVYAIVMLALGKGS